MFDHSGSFDRIHTDSSFKPKGARIQFDPVKFLEIKKTDILFRLTREMGFTSDEAETKFNFIVEIINHLKPLRSCKLQTFDYLEETIRLMPYTLRSINLFFLLPAIRGKIAWNHAWNCLAYYASRDLINPVKSINISEHLILEAIEHENENDHPVNENHSVNQDQKIIKPFSEYLLPKAEKTDVAKKQNQLAEICITVFNKNDSPKDYAIMLCLLSEKGLVVVQNKQRTDFYIAWYNYINKELPLRKNFNAINKYIDDKAECFVFKDEDDGDYRSLKSLFDNILIKNKLE